MTNAAGCKYDDGLWSSVTFSGCPSYLSLLRVRHHGVRQLYVLSPARARARAVPLAGEALTLRRRPCVWAPRSRLPGNGEGDELVRSPRRSRRALGEYSVEHLINLSQMKLSTDGVDVDMVRCLRKTVLVQNVLRRSSLSVMAAFGGSPSMFSLGKRGLDFDDGDADRAESDSDLDEDRAESDSDDDDEHHDDEAENAGSSSAGSSRRLSAKASRVVRLAAASPSGSVISLVIRPPTPPAPLHLAAPADGAASATDVCVTPACPDDASLAEEAEDTDSPSPPPAEPTKAPSALLMSPPDSDMQVVPTVETTPTPTPAVAKAPCAAPLPTPPSTGGLAGRRRSIVEVDEDGDAPAGTGAGVADCAELSPLKRGRSSAPDSGYARACATELTSLAMLL